MLKLADFGYASLLKTEGGQPMSKLKITELRGSLLYMAPEIILHGTFDCRSDWWSVGVLVHEVLTGKCPFHSTSYDELLAKIAATGTVPVQTSMLSPEATELLQGLLQRCPSDRMSLSALARHPFLKLAATLGDTSQTVCSLDVAPKKGVSVA